VPSTAALLGGVAAQEAIKLITRQYIPLDNTAVYDGIQQAIGVFRL
jgi:amyloid beta precursor protein binding protein 1